METDESEEEDEHTPGTLTQDEEPIGFIDKNKGFGDDFDDFEAGAADEDFGDFDEGEAPEPESIEPAAPSIQSFPSTESPFVSGHPLNLVTTKSLDLSNV